MREALERAFAEDGAAREEAFAGHELANCVHDVWPEPVIAVVSDRWVQEDPIHVAQVLVNLVRNGVDAMQETPAGARDLSVRTADAEGAMIELAVRGSGAGIPAQIVGQIFQPFMITSPAGLGLGLSVTGCAVESHRGCIWAVAKPEIGATFRFTLPGVAGKASDAG